MRTTGLTGITATRRHAAAAVSELCRAPTDAAGMLASLDAAVGSAVPNDQVGWQVFDPQAMVPVAVVGGGDPPFEERLLHCEIEQHGADVSPFRALARSARPVARLSEATAGRPARSRRYRELLAPAGFRHELRAALVHQGVCWGALILLRSSGPDFNVAETRWIARSARRIAAGLRTAAATEARARTSLTADEPGPGVLSVVPGGRMVALTLAAQHWRELLAQSPLGRDRVDLAITAAAVRARTGGPARPARVHLPSPAGWVAVTASVVDDTAPVTVVVDRARPRHVLPLLAATHGLTPTEQIVVELVMEGLPSKQIGHRLRISTDTVGDHLKAVYRKTGTNGRGQLRHHLALEAWTASTPT